MNELKGKVVYQIYPLSFKDSNNDGYGDLNGIISKLDYLKSLGVDYLWLSPIYPSPLKDNGYDISSYQEISNIMGDMGTFELLIKKAHELSMKIIMDLVFNHTSKEHDWFKKAINDKNSKYRSYYFFKEGKNNNPPNNWTNFMGQSAWTKLENEENMYYLHLFSSDQPDLNWDNQEVFNYIKDTILFYLKKGVSGFRMDVINLIGKTSFKNGEKNTFLTGQEHYLSSKKGRDFLKRLQQEVIIPNSSFLIGECYNLSLDEAKSYLENEELQECFEFETVSLDKGFFSMLVKPKHFKESIIKWQTELSYNAIYLENHDQKRSIGRFVKEEFALEGSKMLLGLLLTLKGTPFIYQGEELGSRNYAYFDYINTKDMVGKGIKDMLIKKRVPKFLINNILKFNSRDDSRAPMAFTENGDFSTTKPFQKYNECYKIINVEVEEKDPNSTLNFFKELIEFKKNHDSLKYGEISFLTSKKDILLFTRFMEKQENFIIIINLSSKRNSLGRNVELTLENKEMLLSNYSYQNKRDQILYEIDHLDPYEFRIYKV